MRNGEACMHFHYESETILYSLLTDAPLDNTKILKTYENRWESMKIHGCTWLHTHVCRTFLISRIVDDYQNHLKQWLLLTLTTITIFTAGYHHQNHVMFQIKIPETENIGDRCWRRLLTKIHIHENPSPISLLFKSYRK